MMDAPLRVENVGLSVRVTSYPPFVLLDSRAENLVYT